MYAEPMSSEEEARENLKLMYPSVVQLIVQSEATTWARLQSYGILAGFIFTAYSLPGARPETQHALGVAGAVISAVFTLLVVRSRLFVRRYVGYGRAIEAALGIRLDGKDEKENDVSWQGVLTQVHVWGWLPAQIVAPLVPLSLGIVFLLLSQ